MVIFVIKIYFSFYSAKNFRNKSMLVCINRCTIPCCYSDVIFNCKFFGLFKKNRRYGRLYRDGFVCMPNITAALWILNNCQDTYTLRNRKQIIVTCYLFYKILEHVVSILIYQLYVRYCYRNRNKNIQKLRLLF